MKPIASGTPRTDVLCCWPDCFAAGNEERPLCEAHYRQVGMAWIADNIELLRKVTASLPHEIYLDEVLREAEYRRPQREAMWAQQRAEREVGAIVYYVRIADRIKIGYTTDLKTRLRALRVDERALLATEPGGRDVEWRRHQQFADERYGRREDFAPSDRLLAHITGLNPDARHAGFDRSA